jgi:putative pyoverdin transport system ATP-binding/permease protein
MNFVRLLARQGSGSIRRAVLGAVASALSSTIVLALVNIAAAQIAAQKIDIVNLRMAAVFIAGVLLYAAAETWMVRRIGADVEDALDGLRMTLVEKLRHADLFALERFGETALYESITQSCQAISLNSQFLALSLRSALLIVAVLAYIAWISPLAFVLIGLLMVVGGFLYWWMGLTVRARQHDLLARESALFESVSDLFDGFKEQRLNSARSDDLNEAFVGVSGEMTRARDEVHQLGWQQFVFSETAYNLILGVVVFVVPAYAPTFDESVVKVTAACLFMASSVFGLMQSIAVMADSESAAGRMLALEIELASLVEPGSLGPFRSVPTDFSEIRLAGVEFAFPAVEGDEPFSVGPFDVAFKRGETVFITGGNGSGKSTLLKLLTGLYHPARGRVTVDDETIGPDRLAAYRELIATVFTDFHLFARLHDVAASAAHDAPHLVRWMELEHVTAVEGDRFARRELSAGQRKRVALVAALLEQKPILVLDEWAADQDPHFRAKFYREILPVLKQQGLTIIAVTHDDHYFDVADRRLHMEEGRLSEVAMSEGGGPCA